MRERRIASVLFSDLSGFTRLSERMDPEDVADTIDALFQRFRATIEARGGTVDKFIGDAVMAIFGAPVAHADDPVRAIRAGLALQRDLTAFNREKSIDLAMRVGINTGEVLWGSVGGDRATAMGDAVNVAQRLEASAHPGTVLVSSATRNAAASLFRFESRGEVTLKGREERVTVFEITEELSGQTEHRDGNAPRPLVGREAEIERLQGAFESGGMVVLVGEAGIGKSRLLAEFRARVRQTRRDAWIGVGRAYEGVKLPYGPLGEIVRAAVGASGISSEEGERVVASLSAELEASGATPAERTTDARLIALSLGFALAVEPARPPDGARPAEDTVFAWTRWLRALAERRPALLCIEDLHWADESTRSMLAAVAQRLAGSKLSIIATSRPEGLVPPGFAVERVGDLDGEAVSRIAEQIFGAPLEAPLARFLFEKSGGHPFYTEELARFLLANRFAGGNPARLETPPEKLPDGLHGLLVARLDGLAAKTREALKVASALGRSFWPAIVAEIAATDTGVALDDAVSAGVAMAQPASLLPGERQLAFRHSLLRDAAYSLIPRKERQQLHRAGSLAFERRDGGRRLKAMAAEQSKQAGDDSRAHDLWSASAEESSRALSHAEALTCARLALTARRSPRALLATLNALVVLAGYSEAVEMAREIQAASDATEDQRRSARFQEAWCEMLRGRFQEALTIANALVKMPGDDYQKAKHLVLRCSITQTMNRRNDLDALIPDTEAAIARLEAVEPRPEHVRLRANFANILGVRSWQNGRIDEALALYDRVAAICLEEGNMHGVASARHNAGMIYHARGELRRALALYEESVRLRRDAGIRQATAATLSQVARARLVLGEYDNAVRAFQEAMDFSREVGDHYSVVSDGLYLAHLEAHRGRTTRALEICRETETLASRASIQDTRGIVPTGIGVVLFTLGRFEEALPQLLKGLAIRRAAGSEAAGSLSLRLIGDTHLGRRDWESAKTAFLEGEESCLRLDDWGGVATCRSRLAESLRAQGLFAASIEAHGKALDAGNRADLPKVLADVRLTAAAALGEAGRLSEALELVDRVKVEAQRMEIASLIHECARNRGLLLLDLGRVEEARASCDEAFRGIADGATTAQKDLDLILAAEVAAAEGRPADSVEILRKALAESPDAATIERIRVRVLLIRFMLRLDLLDIREETTACAELSERMRDPLGQVLALSTNALVKLREGQAGEALKIVEGLSLLLPPERRPFRARLALLSDEAQIRHAAGDEAGARQAATNGLRIAESAGARLQAAHFERLLTGMPRQDLPS